MRGLFIPFLMGVGITAGALTIAYPIPAPAHVLALPRVDANLYPCDTDAECAATPPCMADRRCDGGPVNGPRVTVVLIGVGCGPKLQTMVAREEDEFGTTCQAIEAAWLPTLER